MRNLVADITELANDANGVCVDQSAAGAAELDLDGALVVDGIAYIGLQGRYRTAQKISIEGSSDESGVDFTITGTDADGTVISEVLAGANAGTALSVLYYNTITSIATDGATTGDVEIGPLATNGAVSRSLRVNGQQMDFKNGVFLLISGTMTASAEYTYMQPEDEYAISYSASADWREVDGADDETASAQSNAFYKVNAMRLKISAYTSGTATLTITQSY